MKDIKFWATKLRFACRQKQVLQSEIYALWSAHATKVREHFKKSINFTSWVERGHWEKTEKFWAYLQREKVKIEKKIIYIRARLKTLGQNDFDLFIWAWNSTVIDTIRYRWPGPLPSTALLVNKLPVLTFDNWTKNFT